LFNNGLQKSKAQVQFEWLKSSTGRAEQDFLQISGAYKKADEYRIIPTVLVGIPGLTPASEPAGVSEIFALSAGFAKANPPSKTSISCGLP
jgi:hypothetical protein